MRKFLLLLLVLPKIAFGQSPKDTICLPTDNVRALVINAEQAKVLRQQVVILNDRISNLVVQQQALKAKDSVTVSLYDQQVKAMTDQRALYTDQLKGYEKLLKRQRTKTTITGLLGILATVGAFMIGAGK